MCLLVYWFCLADFLRLFALVLGLGGGFLFLRLLGLIGLVASRFYVFCGFCSLVLLLGLLWGVLWDLCVGLVLWFKGYGGFLTWCVWYGLAVWHLVV